MYSEDEEINRLIDEAADEYISLDKLLDQIGMTVDEALSEAEQYRTLFFDTLNHCGIGYGNADRICSDVAQLLKKDQGDNTLFLYTSLLSENGLLFGNITDNEHKISLWLEQRERSEYFIRRIKTERILRKRFNDLISHVPQRVAAEFDREEQTLLYDISIEHTFLAKNISSIYLENLGELIRKVNGDTLYSRIKPYIYSAVISNKHKMMLTRAHYSPNIASVFKRTEYKIHKDNGKNFNTYKAYLELYTHLRSCYEDESDIALSDYCFANLNNLSEWFYENCEPTDDIPMTLHQTIDSFAQWMNIWSVSDVNRDILVNVSEYL